MSVQKNITRLFTIGAAVILGCSLISGGVAEAGITPSSSTDKSVLTLESVKQSYLAAKRAKQLRGEVRDVEVSTENPGVWLRKVDNKAVNMVTNRIWGDGQKAVSLEGRSYYVPNDEYGFALNQNPSLRYATDPLTGRRIDKSVALAYADYEGNVLYFESSESYRDFLSSFSR